MDLIVKLLLVFVCLWHSRAALAIEPNISTDRPQPAPSAATTQFDRRPHDVHYSFEQTTEKTPAVEITAQDNVRAPSGNYSAPSQPEASQTVEGTTTTSAPASTATSLLMTTATTTATTTTTTSTTTPSPTTTATISQQQQQQQMSTFAPQPFCTLGDDTFQIGERWNPNLPPFGVQVCVLCECTIRPRKSCYESKVTCRRITNECPVIDSCPDGKKPVTVAGQCCKLCQSTSLLAAQQEGNLQVQQQQPQTLGNQSPAYESQATRGADSQQQPAPSPFKIVYMNERTKDYMSMAKNLPACPVRDSETTRGPSSSSGAGSSPLPGLPTVSKTPKGTRNDLNGIDTRLAFKSLHDSAPNQLVSSKSRQDNPKRFEHSPSEDHHQHPNDVQSVSSSSNNNNNNNNNNNLNQPSSYGRTKQYNSSPDAQAQQPSPNNCVLGNDTFQVGDVWNPNLPPFGVQVCVQCNCIFRARKACYETRVTCRRVNKDCPVIDVCPDGKPPVTVSGQCCKSCPSLVNNVEQQPMNLNGGGGSSTTISPYMAIDGIQRNEKVFREFQAISRSRNACALTQESIDVYNAQRYSRRS